MTLRTSVHQTSRRNFLMTTTGALTALSFEAASRSRTFTSQTTDGNLTSLTLRQASDLLRKKSVTSVALTQACLARIEKLQPSLNAFITVTAEHAMAQAQAMDAEIKAGKWRGPLHGVPIALKDNIDTAGIRTSAASAVFADRVPTEDAEVARRLNAAGAVMLGKLNMDEFASGGTSVMTYFGPVHNPWALDRNAGGSSGGSGAAVAAELCYGALGTDTGGSIRTPASFCGIVGFKPTYGRSSIRGIIPLVWSLDHVGPMCRTVEDAAIMLQAIAGYDAQDTTCVDAPVPDFVAGLKQSVTGLRLGIPRVQFYDKLDADVSAAINAAIEVLRKLTASSRDVVLPSVRNATLNGETYAYHEPFFTKTPNLYQPSLRRRLEQAGKALAMDYVQGRMEMERLRREIGRFFSDVDLLVTPTVKIPPRTIEEALKRLEAGTTLPPELANTGQFNVLGLPTISLPCGFTKNGLPIGLQISGPHWAETRVLALAAAYERATEWHKQRPPLKAERESKSVN